MVTRVAQALSWEAFPKRNVSLGLPVRPKAWCGHSTPTPQDAGSPGLGPAQTSILPSWPRKVGLEHIPQPQERDTHTDRHSLFRHMPNPAPTGLVGPSVQYHQNKGHCRVMGAMPGPLVQ